MTQDFKDPFLTAFEQPSLEHTACPLWFWNGEMQPQEILRQIGLMFEKGIRSFVIHGRVGITIAYLSETWFARCQVALDEAARLGMKVWIYDEDNWPSGYAGGRVLVRDPNFVAQNLKLERHYLEAGKVLNLQLESAENVRAVLACRLERIEALPVDPLAFVTAAKAAAPWSDTTHFEHVYADHAPLKLEPDQGCLRWIPADGRWCVMVFRQAATHWNAAYSDQPYIDLLSDAATTAFIEETHERYWTRFASHFDSTILGFFVDEPGFYNNFWTTNVGTLTWTHDLSEQFEQRRGYPILEHLPALWENLGERSTQVRLDYWHTVAELLEERFFGKLARWCSDHGVMLTGHLHYEEWLFVQARNSVNPFTALAPFHVPGVDKIDEVSDKLAEKLIASVAHAHGKARVLSETYALTGWKLAPPYMKQILDYQLVRGINWIVPHGFYYSTDDFRKRECPPSEFFQNPWWDHSQPFWNHLARLCAVLSQGQHVAPILLYYPIEQAHATMTPSSPAAMPMGHVFETWQLPQPHLPVQYTDLSMIHLGLHLLEHQWDFDLLDHTVLALARLEDKQIKLGEEGFRAVVVPAIDVMQASVLQKFLAFAETGGTVLFVNRLPSEILEGQAPVTWTDLRQQLSSLNRPEVLQVGSGWVGFVPEGIQATSRLLSSVLQADVKLEIAQTDQRWLSSLENRNGMFREARIKPLRHAIKYHRRHIENQDAYFLVNESDQAFDATLELAGAGHVQELIPHSGEHRAVSSQAINANRLRVSIRFEPWESHLLLLSEIQNELADQGTEPRETHRVSELELTDWTLELDGTVHTGRLESWSVLGHSAFSGIGTYSTVFDWTETLDSSITLDLGVVLETAEVSLNGVSLPPLAWSPYRTNVTAQLRSGQNELVVKVANTNANAFEARERPSGLLGPVRLMMKK